MDSKALKILSLPVDDGGCGWYRVRQPFAMIQNHTEHDTHIIDPVKDDSVAVLKALSMADVVVMRQGAEISRDKLTDTVNEYLKETGGGTLKAKWVLDIDDNIELISPYSEHYHEYGTKEIYDRNQQQWLWKDGVADFDVARNTARINNLIDGMKKADLVTVTTEKLAQYAKKYNKNVAVLPNCVDLDRWWKLNLRPKSPLRVGWSGGVSHYEDWYSIKKPLNDLMRKYKFTLVSIGAAFQGLIDDDNKQYLEVQDWVPFKGHSYRMMCMDLDIAVIPLSDLPFNNYKSSIKWYEMSAMGVPSVVSNILPYKEDISDMVAMPYKTPEQFYKQLEYLLKSEHMRRGVGDAAQKWVKQHRSAKVNAKTWIDAYKSIL